MKSPGLRHALRILALLSAGPLSFNRLRQQLALPPATAARLLKVLAEEGWVEGGGEAPWKAGPALQACAARLGGTNDLGALLGPTVTALAHEAGESAALVTLDERGFRFLAKQEMPDSYHYMAVGAVNQELDVHPIGQCLLSYDETRRRQVAGTALDPLAQRIRTRGWHHGFRVGLRWVAPVLLPGDRLAGALVVSTLGRNCPTGQRIRLGRLVLKHAQDASRLLATSATTDRRP